MTSRTPKYTPTPIRAATGPSPFRSVVCGVDGSLTGHEAIAQAIALSAPETALSFVCVRHEAGEGLVHEATIGAERAEQALREAVALARKSGVEATAETVPGRDVSGPLLDRASEADELVVASHGGSRAAGILLESTASVAVHRATVPVLVARRPPEGAEFPHRVLVATDGSDAAERAVGLASDIARRHHSPLTIVAADPGDLPELEDAAARASEIAAQRGLEPKIRLERGRPEECILEAAERDESSLIVLGSRGVTGLRALGSVSERVAHRAHCSVLVVRPPDEHTRSGPAH
jgi:nucleotide-binding universal stress UspA family protein